jgi:hypothetical protein
VVEITGDWRHQGLDRVEERGEEKKGRSGRGSPRARRSGSGRTLMETMDGVELGGGRSSRRRRRSGGRFAAGRSASASAQRGRVRGGRGLPQRRLAAKRAAAADAAQLQQ